MLCHRVSVVDDMIVRRNPRTSGRLRLITLSAAVAASGFAGGGLPVAVASAAPERAAYRTQALPHGTVVGTAARASTGAASARRTRIDLRPARRFSLAALRWADGARPIAGRLRAQRADGSWTAWSELESERAGADGVAELRERAPGAAATRERGATIGRSGSTEPIWTGPSRRLQVEIVGARPTGVRAAFVDVTGTIPKARAARAKAQTDMAGIQPRAAWDPNDECKPRSAPGIGSVQGVAVHHTAGSNEYSVDQVPAVILAICKYHRNANGWNDVGYNVIVDKYGGAWEGRAGGLTQAVVGAHAQGFNAVSAGISMIGDFSAITPPPAMLSAVARVAAWKLAVAGVPREGTVDLTSAGGSLSRFRAGAVASLPRVFAHRDVGQTACPGDAGYATLDGVRSRVASADPTLPVNLPATPAPAPQPVKITINARQRVAVGADAVVSGTATQGAAPLKSAALALQVGKGERWQTVSTTRTNAAGKYRFARRFTRSWGMRVTRTDGDGGTSARVEMVIVPKLTLTVPKRMKLGKRITLRGTIKPGRGPVTLTIERRTKAGRYVAVATQKTALNGRTITTAIKPGTATLYRFRLKYAGSDLAAPANSPLVFGRAVANTTTGGAAAVN